MSDTSISIQLITSSTVVVDRLSSGLHPVPVVHSAAAELNKHMLEDKPLPPSIGPTTLAHRAAFATPDPKKRDNFSLGQRACQAKVVPNIGMEILWNNIAPSIPSSKDWAKGSCTPAAGLTKHLPDHCRTRPQPPSRPIKGRVAAEPQNSHNYSWTLGMELQGLQNELFLGNPTNSSTKSEFDGEQAKTPSIIPTSSERIIPASLTGRVNRPALGRYSSSPSAIPLSASAINDGYIQHAPRTTKLETNTSGLLRTLSTQSTTTHTLTPTSLATTNRSSPVFSDLGSGRSWSEFSFESGRFSPATTPPSSPVDARSLDPWSKNETVKNEDVNDVSDGDDNDPDVVMSAIHAHDDSVRPASDVRSASDGQCQDDVSSPVASAQSYAIKSSCFRDGGKTAAENLFAPSVVAESVVAESPQKTYTKRFPDGQIKDLHHLMGNTGSKRSLLSRGQKKTRTQPPPRPEPTPVRPILASSPRLPITEQTQRKAKPTSAPVRTASTSSLGLRTERPSLSREAKTAGAARQHPYTPAAEIVVPRTSSGSRVGIKRPASTEQIHPKKRQATSANAVRPTKPMVLEWENELNRFEHLIYDGKSGPGQISGVVKLLKGMSAKMEVIDAKWVTIPVRIKMRGDEHKTRLEMLELIVDVYGGLDADGQVTSHADALLTRWRSRQQIRTRPPRVEMEPIPSPPSAYLLVERLPARR
ncbi:hypothetical protein C8R45DRAFT_959120 [Mycena sanguinolenta]|nr:hypothetical protein C8R45DRAFT_959120 [Mycena sanguinolenta]